jgi:hypothetical protein
MSVSRTLLEQGFCFRYRHQRHHGYNSLYLQQADRCKASEELAKHAMSFVAVQVSISRPLYQELGLQEHQIDRSVGRRGTLANSYCTSLAAAAAAADTL